MTEYMFSTAQLSFFLHHWDLTLLVAKRKYMYLVKKGRKVQPGELLILFLFLRDLAAVISLTFMLDIHHSSKTISLYMFPCLELYL